MISGIYSSRTKFLKFIFHGLFWAATSASEVKIFVFRKFKMVEQFFLFRILHFGFTNLNLTNLKGYRNQVIFLDKT